MKTIFSLLILLASIVCNAQRPESEVIDWNNLAAFTAQKITFKSNEIDFECKDCKCLEIKAQSGVTGFFILGNGQFNIKNKKIKDDAEACLIKFNPSDQTSFIEITSKKEMTDKEFFKQPNSVLKKLFGHSYHSGMDALIPPKGDYSLAFIAKKYGDILASFAKEKKIVFSFTEKKEL